MESLIFDDIDITPLPFLNPRINNPSNGRGKSIAAPELSTYAWPVLYLKEKRKININGPIILKAIYQAFFIKKYRLTYSLPCGRITDNITKKLKVKKIFTPATMSD